MNSINNCYIHKVWYIDNTARCTILGLNYCTIEFVILLFWHKTNIVHFAVIGGYLKVWWITIPLADHIKQTAGEIQHYSIAVPSVNLLKVRNYTHALLSDTSYQYN